MGRVLLGTIVVSLAVLSGCCDNCDKSCQNVSESPFQWSFQAQNTEKEWKLPPELESVKASMAGTLQESFNRVQDRLSGEPFDKNFVLADVNFNQKRWFTNFSGDISGRFLESVISIKDESKTSFNVMKEVLSEIAQYQKEDGHFGIPVDWEKAIDFNPASDGTVMMPILWGNGRLLLGLTAAAKEFNRPEILESAKKLGNFYIDTVIPRFCNPTKMDEYRQKAQYATSYITCVYEGMEGLDQLYRLTKDDKYLKAVEMMANFHQLFDTLPVGHSHGSLSQTGALVMIYEDSGNEVFLRRAIGRWEELVSQGYINICGGVLEKLEKTGYDCDEGCSEADWLRLNLLLWKNTGNVKYLDMAERQLRNHFTVNQWERGGFGHRRLGMDAVGAYSYADPVAESLWCCTYHGAMALDKLRSYLVVGSEEGIYLNFVADFEGIVNVGGNNWQVKSATSDVRYDEKTGIYSKDVTYTFNTDKAALLPTLYVRFPEWAKSIDGIRLEQGASQSGYYVGKFNGKESTTYTLALTYNYVPYLEKRDFTRVELTEQSAAEQVALHLGYDILLNAESGDIQDLPVQKIENTPVIPWDKVKTYSDITNKTARHAFIFNVSVKK